MKLADLTIKEFLAKVAGNEPVPGGGSIAALNAAIAVSLNGMVAGLTIGKKKYADAEEDMKWIVERMEKLRNQFIEDIDSDSEAYNEVFSAYKLPKETEEERKTRNTTIQEATKKAALVPMEVARNAEAMMASITEVADRGNKNAITDACVAMMCARTAVVGALLNVRINLSSIDDQEFVQKLRTEALELEQTAWERENGLLRYVKEEYGL